MASTYYHPASSWDSHASQWTTSVEEVTLSACAHLLDLTTSLSPIPSPSSSSSSESQPQLKFLDSGAGAGQITRLLKSRYPHSQVLATDISKEMLSSLSMRAREAKWSNVQTSVQDLQSMPSLSSDSFSHVFCAFAIPFVQEPESALKEIYRVLVPGGAAGISTWALMSWVPFWEEAVCHVQSSSNYKAPDTFHPGTMDEQWLRDTMWKIGFKDVNVEGYQCDRLQKNVDVAIEQFYGMSNPTITLLMGGLEKETIEKTKPIMKEKIRSVWEKEGKFQPAILVTGRKE